MWTLVERECVQSWIDAASKQVLEPYTTLASVSKGMNATQPTHAWHSLKVSKRSEIWVVCDIETHTPALVSHIGVVQEAASRAHGTYVPEQVPIPYEYNPDRTTRVCNFMTKQYWAMESQKGDTRAMGYLLKNIEKHMGKYLGDIFETSEEKAQAFRSGWNVPNSGDSYWVEHPIVASQSVAAHYGDPTDESTLHPFISAGLIKAKDLGKSTGKPTFPLVEVPGRPRVLIKQGSYHDADAPVVECKVDDDYHREGDIVWLGGMIYCVVNKSIGRRKTWQIEFRPDTITRIARLWSPTPKKQRNNALRAVNARNKRPDFTPTPFLPKSFFMNLTRDVPVDHSDPLLASPIKRPIALPRTSSPPFPKADSEPEISFGSSQDKSEVSIGSSQAHSEPELLFPASQAQSEPDLLFPASQVQSELGLSLPASRVQSEPGSLPPTLQVQPDPEPLFPLSQVKLEPMISFEPSSVMQLDQRSEISDTTMSVRGASVANSSVGDLSDDEDYAVISARRKRRRSHKWY